MKEQDLDVIKTRTLMLKNGVCSSEIVLTDPDGGDMYFTFEIRYISDTKLSQTHIYVTDIHHAKLVIDTTPAAITKPKEMIEIGTYGKNNKKLYLGFYVQPQIVQDGDHNVTITFYTGKEVDDGI